MVITAWPYPITKGSSRAHQAGGRASTYMGCGHRGGWQLEPSRSGILRGHEKRERIRNHAYFSRQQPHEFAIDMHGCVTVAEAGDQRAVGAKHRDALHPA